MNEARQLSPVALREARERVISALCTHFAEDRLDIADFESRVDRAHRATALTELDALLADLPSSTAQQAPAPAPARPAVPDTKRRKRELLAAILGGNTRRGPWTPARRSLAVAVMGGIELDFREAALPPGPTELDIYCFMGGVTLIVPPDLALEINGIPIMGGIDAPVQAAPPADPRAPVLRIDAVVIMGGVEVSVRMPGESERDARRRRRAEKKLRPST
ncbi:MAG TPA: DUF1707 domain-containing protein [Longimicrobiales bacterium]